MKFLIYTDIHIKEYSNYIGYNIIDSNGLTKELSNYVRGIEFIVNQIDIHKPDMVINLGDTVNIVDNLSIREITTLSYLDEIYNKCKGLGIPHIILQGNHDIFNYNCNLDIGRCISKYCDKYIRSIESDTINNIKIHYIPYLSMSDELVRSYLDESYDIIFTHNEFIGSIYENGIPSNTSLRCINSIPVISGHIHKPQIVNNIIYVGSLISNKFVKDIGIHGVGIFNTDDKRYITVENTLSKHYIKCIDLDEVFKLDPHRYIIKLQTKIDKSIVEDKLKDSDYSYFYVKELEKKSESEIRYITKSKSSDPKEVLRDYLKSENPEVIDLYDSILNK